VHGLPLSILFILITTMKYKLPIIIINFKTYKEIYGNNGLKIAKAAEQVSKEEGLTIMIAPPIAEVMLYTTQINIPVISQHVDAHEPDRGTGMIPVELIKSTGAVGSIVNHSEHPVNLNSISFVVDKLKKYDMISCVCVQRSSEAGSIAILNPDMVAIEPPELIGGNISVSTAKPEIVAYSVENVREQSNEVAVLCGAGIKSDEDVKKAVDLDVDGILISSGVVLSKNPKEIIENLASGF
jgi:triosephosphate isomerase